MNIYIRSVYYAYYVYAHSIHNVIYELINILLLLLASIIIINIYVYVYILYYRV